MNQNKVTCIVFGILLTFSFFVSIANAKLDEAGMSVYTNGQNIDLDKVKTVCRIVEDFTGTIKYVELPSPSLQQGIGISREPVNKTDCEKLRKAREEFDKWFKIYKDQDAAGDDVRNQFDEHAKEGEDIIKDFFLEEARLKSTEEAAKNYLNIPEWLESATEKAELIKFIGGYIITMAKEYTILSELQQESDQVKKIDTQALKSLHNAADLQEKIRILEKQCNQEQSSKKQGDHLSGTILSSGDPSSETQDLTSIISKEEEHIKSWTKINEYIKNASKEISIVKVQFVRAQKILEGAPKNVTLSTNNRKEFTDSIIVALDNFTLANNSYYEMKTERIKIGPILQATNRTNIPKVTDNVKPKSTVLQEKTEKTPNIGSMVVIVVIIGAVLFIQWRRK